MWSAYLVETRTGFAGARLELADGTTWAEGPLNKASSATVVVHKSALERVQPWRWSPWAGSIVLCYNDEPIVGGPILEPPSFADDMIEFAVGDMGWTMLEHRIVTKEDYGPGKGKELAESVLEYRGMARGDIAWDLVARSMNRPSGYLPISRATPASTSDRQRTYEGFNVANNSTAKRLFEMSETIGGPDIAFRPRWEDKNRRNRIWWDYVCGTEDHPTIAQDRQISSLQVSADWEPVSRAYATGTGQGAGLAIQIADDEVREHLPFIERVFNESQVIKDETLLEKAKEAVAAGQRRTVQVKLAVPLNDPYRPLHMWHTGDTVNFYHPKGNILLPEGVHKMVILKRSGSVSSGVATVELQSTEVPVW